MCLDPVTAAAAYGVSRLAGGGSKGGDTTNNTYVRTPAPETPAPVAQVTAPAETVQDTPQTTSDDSSLTIPKKETTKTPKKKSLRIQSMGPSINL